MTHMEFINTNRCALTPLTVTDCMQIAEIFTCNEARRYLGGAVPYFKGFMSLYRSLSETNARYFAVRLHEEYEILGMVTIAPHHNPTDMEISYIFAQKHWGNGYAQECISAVLDFCRKELQLARVVSETQVANAKSCKLLEGLGYRPESTFDRFGAAQILYVYEF